MIRILISALSGVREHFSRQKSILFCSSLARCSMGIILIFIMSCHHYSILNHPATLKISSQSYEQNRSKTSRQALRVDDARTTATKIRNLICQCNDIMNQTKLKQIKFQSIQSALFYLKDTFCKGNNQNPLLFNLFLPEVLIIFLKRKQLYIY